MSKINKVDLTLLKKLFGEMESILNTAESLKTADKNEYILEMAKAHGAAIYIATEAAMIAGDIQKLTLDVQSPVADASSNPLLKMFGGGGGNKN